METIRPADRSYPERLAAVSDPPSLLYVLGNLRKHERIVAIVGSRAAPRAATERAYQLAHDLGRADTAIVSGGALGVDTASHRGALAAGAATVAVLGNGLDIAYPPRNARLFDDIPRRGGALVTIYKEGYPPMPHNFVRRNRIIAAMADAVVVVDAGARSGALHTARAGRGYGRRVLAVPGSAGTEWLLCTGAGLVETADDVLAALRGETRRPEVELPESNTEQGKVLLALDACVGRNPAELSSHTGLNPRRINQHLLGLELSGLAVSLPGHMGYVRSPLARELLAEARDQTQ